jgi:tetratricopeptide (TPR) repeat protein
LTLCFQPNSPLVAVNDVDRIRLYDVEKGELTLDLPFPDSGIGGWLSFDADGHLLAATRPNRDVLLWDLAELQDELAQLGIEIGRIAPTRLPDAAAADIPVVIDRGGLPAASEWCLYWRALAQAEAWQKRWPDAIYAMNSALDQTPSPKKEARAELLSLRGQYLCRNGELKSASEDWREALELDPRATTALRGLAGLLTLGPPEMRDLVSLRFVRSKFESVESDSPDDRILRALADIRLERFGAGLAQIDPDQIPPKWKVQALYLVSIAQRQIGDIAEADETLSRAKAEHASQNTLLGEDTRAELDRLREEAESGLPRLTD